MQALGSAPHTEYINDSVGRARVRTQSESVDRNGHIVPCAVGGVAECLDCSMHTDKDMIKFAQRRKPRLEPRNIGCPDFIDPANTGLAFVFPSSD